MKCRRCERDLPVSDFCPSKQTASGYQPWCRLCFKEYNREWYALNRKRILESKKVQYARRKHGQPVLPE